MKLVELLARELVSWPANIDYITQDFAGEINLYVGSIPRRSNNNTGTTWTVEGFDRYLSINGILIGNRAFPTCEDWDTAIVTETDYKNELSTKTTTSISGYSPSHGWLCNDPNGLKWLDNLGRSSIATNLPDDFVLKPNT